MCFLKAKNKGGSGDKATKWTKKESKQYVNQVIESKMNGTVVSDIIGGSKPKKKPNWAKGLTSGAQIYIMGIARQEEVNVDELDNKDLDDCKKQAKRVSK